MQFTQFSIYNCNMRHLFVITVSIMLACEHYNIHPMTYNNNCSFNHRSKNKKKTCT